ncbi:MAG: Ig-like domain-containing protein, partial [Aquincola sp.]|nr:Ig-like domain-containing protein [Aquincola sp.]
ADASIARDNGRARNTGAGTNANIGAGQVPLVDIDGEPRPTAVDIGADEIPPPPMHIGDLDWTAAVVDSFRWRATVTVTVHDANHAVVANATVTGTWSAGDTNGRSLTCTTNAQGQCTVTSGRVTALTNRTVQFTVTGVSAAAFAYQPTVNHDPDAAPQSSDGTTVTASPTFFMHVGDLDWTSTNTSATQWSASVTVTVHGVDHGAVSGAVVTFAWVGGGSGGTSCTTNASGQCTVTRTALSRTNVARVTAAVTNVATAGMFYTLVDNHDPDAALQNSNGTSITVPRP